MDTVQPRDSQSRFDHSEIRELNFRMKQGSPQDGPLQRRMGPGGQANTGIHFLEGVMNSLNQIQKVVKSSAKRSCLKDTPIQTAKGTASKRIYFVVLRD
jgi:hypothetical protein